MVGGTTIFHDVPASTTAVLISRVPTGSVGFQQEPATMYVTGGDTFLLGPALEVPFLKHFSLEVDGLHHSIEVSRRTVLSNGEVADSFSGAEALTWEFPVLGKYRFGAGRVTPFVEAGPSFRLLTENSSVFGIGGGAGLEVRWRSLKIAPALRFTHWGPQGYHIPSTKVIVNQVEFVTGFLL
jgi:hypothetical protein